jgi:hypothetical protein
VQYCGPIDVVFVIDTTASMGNALYSVESAFTNTINEIVQASGGDYRMGLVTFDGSCANNPCGTNIDGDFVAVWDVLAPTNQNQVGNDIANLGIGYGGVYRNVQTRRSTR